MALSYISLKVGGPCYWQIPTDNNKNEDRKIENRFFVGINDEAESKTIKDFIQKEREKNMDKLSLAGLTDYLTKIRKDESKKKKWKDDGLDIPICYFQYLRLLKLIAKSKKIREKYQQLDDDIKTAYEHAFSFEPDKDKREEMAIMAHLEKMLFMQKEKITRVQQ